MADPVTSGDLCSPRHDVPDVHLLALIAGQIIVQRSTARILCGGETWICNLSQCDVLQRQGTLEKLEWEYWRLRAFIPTVTLKTRTETNRRATFSLPFKNAFNGIFVRWMPEVNPKDRGIYSSFWSQNSARQLLETNCGHAVYCPWAPFPHITSHKTTHQQPMLAQKGSEGFFLYFYLFKKGFEWNLLGNPADVI